MMSIRGWGRCSFLASLVACSAEATQPTGPDETAAPSTATVEAPKTLGSAESCAEVAKAFGFASPFNAHVRRYGFPESLDKPETPPIFEGSADENAKAIEGALASYEKAKPTLDVEVLKAADAFAEVAKKRVTNIVTYKKAEGERSAQAKTPKEKALADAACFGTTGMVNDKCPQAIFGTEVQEMSRAADALEARCSAKAAP